MPTISVDHLRVHFRTHEKEAGFGGSLKSLFARKYRDIKAVDDISFTIDEGELIGFIGPNGAGKTSTLKTLSGLLYPTSGSVSVLGFEPFKRKNEFLKQISLVMGQKNQLWWDLPANETFLLNKEIYQVPDVDYKKNVKELTQLLEVEDILNVQVRRLSLGQRMKCELIAALIHSPRVLFLDEPTIGLDVVMQKKLREFVKEYNKQFNSTIILTSHYMEDVKELCERVIIIDHGKILYDGKLEDIVKQFTTTKLLSVTFNKKIERNELEHFGIVKEYDPLKSIISVPVEKSKHVAAVLLEKYPVDDLNIEETSIEDIVRDIFSKKVTI